mgnify:FL=1
MKFKFDVTTLETLEVDFAKAKALMSEWEWHSGGYLALYLSQKNRLLKAKENAELKKNSRTKK